MLCSLLTVALAQTSEHRRAAEVVYDLTTNEDGWIEASATFWDLGRRDLAFREMGSAPEYLLRDVIFSSANGVLEATRKDSVWTLKEVPADGPIHVRWSFQPGGMGRHGHQGFLDPAWTSFDGRNLLLPIGRKSLRTMRFRYNMPTGWSVVHPWVEENGWVVATHPTALKSILSTTCVAAGVFDIRSRTIGNTEVRVGSPAAWDAAWRDRLADKTWRLFSWFHEDLGFDRRAPFAIAWLPKPDGEQVFGGASVNGACYEHPVEQPRPWLLLGHRIAHPMNKYVPAGLTIRDERDHWFTEGWASYIEVVGADRSGILPDQRHWNVIYRRYMRTIAKEPSWNVPLAEERKHGKAHEFLHYTKGPLVVHALANLIQRRSGVTLEAFMKHAWKTHGFHRSAFALREELEQFTGDDYSDFWQVFVDQPGLLYPGWGELLDKTLTSRMNRKAAATVGSLRVHPDYLFWLAWSGRFERYADIVTFLESSALAHERLRVRDLELLSDAVADVRYGLPAMSQYAVDATAQNWPLDRLTERGGCSSSSPVQPRIEWSDSPVSKTFQRLMQLEQTYEQSLGPQVAHIQVRARGSWHRGGDRLGVGPGEDIVVRGVWTTAPVRALFQVGADGSPVSRQKRMTLDPSWSRTHTTFAPKDRPADASILLVRVGRDGGEGVVRPVWQLQTSYTPTPQEPR